MDSNSCIVEIVYKLLEFGYFDSNEFCLENNINKRKIYRYISIIKTKFFNLGLYHIDIFYSRSSQVYKCIINN